MSDEDISSFSLPLSWKPGSDLMSKLLFNDPMIVNLVVKSLLGTDVPEDIYTVASNEWADDFNSTFIVYISQNENSSRFTPIVINIREVVDSDSMSDTILFSTLVYEKYKISPIVLIIPSTPINREELGISEDTFLIPLKSTFWAHKCFLFSPSGISSADDRSTPTSLVALCQFISNPSKTFSLYEAQPNSICFTCEAKSNV